MLHINLTFAESKEHTSRGIKYNKAKQPSGIKKVSGGCFFELRIRELTASVKYFFLKDSPKKAE